MRERIFRTSGNLALTAAQCVRAAIMLAAVLVVASCSTPPFYRVVYVPPGRALRLRADVPDVPVWVRLKNGETVPSKIDLKEGWYVLPDPGKKGGR